MPSLMPSRTTSVGWQVSSVSIHPARTAAAGATNRSRSARSSGQTPSSSSRSTVLPGSGSSKCTYSTLFAAAISAAVDAAAAMFCLTLWRPLRRARGPGRWRRTPASGDAQRRFGAFHFASQVWA